MNASENEPLFRRMALIGAGLIGSSLAHVARREGLAGHIAVSARTQETLDKALELGFADSVSLDAAEAARDADLVVLCTPLGVYGDIAKAIQPALKSGAIVSDVGSCKGPMFIDVQPHLPDGVHMVPGHPVAGTEHSGPAAEGFPLTYLPFIARAVCLAIAEFPKINASVEGDGSPMVAGSTPLIAYAWRRAWACPSDRGA